eukprot:TRINITY_DN2813_c0_g1_i1.p2 TRINITY_DN2813_c0_g1~~TRINITY_DN2813_c0_g1_i1.p2  ORF type:complete len:110 (-),score=13.68 TRINITY_DN2813_c0_g1_i1:440-769(-)
MCELPEKFGICFSFWIGIRYWMSGFDCLIQSTSSVEGFSVIITSDFNGTVHINKLLEIFGIRLHLLIICTTLLNQLYGEEVDIYFNGDSEEGKEMENSDNIIDCKIREC